MFERPTADVSTQSFRWWFLPSWLGLDAPCVVSTWTWAISQATNVAWPLRAVVAMFWVVWLIYLSDRLIDVARCQDWTQATGRLRFGRDFRWLFWLCMSLCVVGLLALLVVGVSAEVLWRGAVVALGVGLHFLLFVVPVLGRDKLPGKEFGVGLFFALGAYACLGATRQSLPLLACIALVVAFNCLVIADRDAESDRTNDRGGASRWWRTMHRDLLWVGVMLILVALLAACFAEQKAFYLAVAASFIALALLHFHARRFSGDAVRALADFALFTPLPILGIAHLICVFR